MRTAKNWAPVLSACTLAVTLALVGCSKDSEQAAQGAAAQQMPPAQVGVIVAQPQSVENVVEMTGRTSAYQISEVRPQASGVILKRLFTEGSYVRRGQALYEIDDRTNRASVDNYKAAERRAQANLNARFVQRKGVIVNLLEAMRYLSKNMMTSLRKYVWRKLI